jgi:hypothetical protein
MTKSLLQINVRRLVKKFEISKEFLDDMEQESKILDEFIERRKKTYNVLFSSNVFKKNPFNKRQTYSPM